MATSRRALIKRAATSGAAITFCPLENIAAQSPAKTDLPNVPYGAVYFRKTAPPSQDWQHDYRQAASDGMNAFRHWFMWSAIEVAPGQYDWGEYDRQLDLAAEHGIATIVGEILSTAPQWAFAKYPHARMETADGRIVGPHYNNAAAVGGWPGLSLDNDDVLEVAEEFIRQLVLRYRSHPAMAGYDVWNELNHLGDAGGCWCEASAQKFRTWLRDRYGDLKTLGEASYRYSYTDWDQVRIPRTIGPYPDSIDWGLFRVDNAMRIFERRVKLIRELDPSHPITRSRWARLKSSFRAPTPPAVPIRYSELHGWSTSQGFRVGAITTIVTCCVGGTGQSWTLLVRQREANRFGLRR
ncbi:MAG: beta-galactosidase [Planctomycetota bacterium]